jgi:hypothetical protein
MIPASEDANLKTWGRNRQIILDINLCIFNLME